VQGVNSSRARLPSSVTAVPLVKVSKLDLYADVVVVVGRNVQHGQAGERGYSALGCHTEG
jgi:hypothetical protein